MVERLLEECIDSWYLRVTNDAHLRHVLRHSTYCTVNALTNWYESRCFSKTHFLYSMVRIDWEALLTRHLVDDFASHIRLYRYARERAQDDTLSSFFVYEVEMEHDICHDLVSTQPQYMRGKRQGILTDDHHTHVQHIYTTSLICFCIYCYRQTTTVACQYAIC